MSLSPREAFRRRLLFEPLEERRVLTAAFAEFVDPHPSAGDRFGATIVSLSTGNVVITAPSDNAGGTEAGAVYLFNGRTGALISTLIGSQVNDRIGANGVTALTNGNYVVSSPSWDNGMTIDAGAVTFGSGTSGVSGVVSAANSLVGPGLGGVAGEQVGSQGVTALTNGNYVVNSPNWYHYSALGSAFGAGAVTFGNGTSGVSGEVSTANSLFGITQNDHIGGGGVNALTNGNYVVSSPSWDNGTTIDAGAVTFGNGTSGTSGAVSTANSLFGGTKSDQIGSSGVTALTNGNYVVSSPSWDNGMTIDSGAVTFGSGTSGVSGVVSAANSLVGPGLGGVAGEQVGSQGVTALTNGNYVVNSPNWYHYSALGSAFGAGAVTFGNGTSGVSGEVSTANSLFGITQNDHIGGGGVNALTNGNYVVSSPSWDNGTTIDAGAVTFGNGTSGTSGAVSTANSLFGGTKNDQIGSGGVTALTNGNYVVSSPSWDNGMTIDAGAVTFGSGTSGVSGVVSAASSLVGPGLGGVAGEQVGSQGVTALTNGNYVVSSPHWRNGGASEAGAATFGNGASGISGEVSSANSLVGGPFDNVGYGGVTALTNGNYVVSSPIWHNGGMNSFGAVTFGDGANGISGAVSTAISLVGTTSSDELGSGGVTALADGNYAVDSPSWDNGTTTDAGALTFGNGMTGVSGVVSAANSLVGGAANTNLQPAVVDNVNHNFFGPFFTEGQVRVGSQIDGFTDPWHNASRPNDVNNDGHIAPNDALAIINYINGFGSGSAPANAMIGQPFGFLDTTGGASGSGDDFVAPNDALAVINAINAGQGGEGESLTAGMNPAVLGTKNPKLSVIHDDWADLLAFLALDTAQQNAPRRHVL